jgi:hypothetical protein
LMFPTASLASLTKGWKREKSQLTFKIYVFYHQLLFTNALEFMVILLKGL